METEKKQINWKENQKESSGAVCSEISPDGGCSEISLVLEFSEISHCEQKKNYNESQEKKSRKSRSKTTCKAKISTVKIKFIQTNIDQDLSYGEILVGRPGAWLVKFFLYACNKKKLKRDLMLTFKMISRTCLNCMIAFMVYE